MFTGLSLGVLKAAAFRANTTGLAGDPSFRIICETASGRHYFEADGTGAGARIQFATMASGLALTEAGFCVI